MALVFKKAKNKDTNQSYSPQALNCYKKKAVPKHYLIEKGTITPLRGKTSLPKPSNNNTGLPKNLWLNPVFSYGGHVGHKPIRLPPFRARFPGIGEYLIGDRNGVAVINSHLTLEGAAKGLYLSAAVLRKKGHILVIDTRDEASPLKNLVENSNCYIPSSLSFSGSRWIGGSLTNWDYISIVARRCAQISKQFDAFITQSRIYIPRYEKMKQAFPGFIKASSPHHRPKADLDLPLFGGTASNSNRESKTFVSAIALKSGEVSSSFLPFLDLHQAKLRFKRRPDLLWILNPNENRHIIEEAERLSIPTIGVVDSNTDFSNITVSIPVNINASFWSNKLITLLLSLSKFVTSSDLKDIAKQ